MAAPVGRLAVELVLAAPKLAGYVGVVLDRPLEAISEALGRRLVRTGRRWPSRP
jgi:hypothetical protein